MNNDVIPDDVRQFILQHIDSIVQLEGLLMLYADPHKKWDAETIARGLYIDKSEATALLARLLQQDFLVMAENGKVSHYQYQPKSHELGEVIARIADLYRRYLVPVTNLIHSKSKNKIQEFANAFRIRKD